MTAIATAPSLTAPPPAFTPDEALGLAERHFGRTGRLDRLTSERDLNFRLTTAAGDSFVFKIGNAAEPAEVTEFQTGALLHVAARDPALPVPRVIPALDGRSLVPLPGGEVLRLLSWVEGRPMHLVPSTPALRRSLGVAAARLTRALEGFNHPAAGHELLWDIRNAARLRPFLPSVGDPRLHDLAALWLARFEDDIAPALSGLPWQVVHADLNPFNVLTDATGRSVAGILDFGDMVLSHRICDLAVAASYLIDPADPAALLVPLTRACHRANPLTQSELRLLPELITARLVTTLVISAWRAARYPENAPYILRNAPTSRAGLDALTDTAALTSALLHACESQTP